MQIYRFITLAILLLPFVTFGADKFEIDGIFYQPSGADDGTCYVTASSENNLFTSEITIPQIVTDPEGNRYEVTSIGKSAFEKCENLVKVSLPNTITSIGYSAFSNCFKLSSINLSDNITTIDNFAFSLCYDLVLDRLPENVVNIGTYAFYACHNITISVIPSKMRKIEYGAFAGRNKMPSLTILGSLEVIEEKAFADCDFFFIKLDSFNLPIGSYNAFSQETYLNTPLYISKNLLAQFNNQQPWVNFKNIYSVDEMPVYPTSFTLNYDKIQINKGESVQLNPIFTPENTSYTNVQWNSSSNWNISVSDSGLVTGNYAGSSIITATCLNLSASCEVTVVVPAESISLNKTDAILSVGDTFQLTARVSPYDTTDPTVLWSSSNSNVATINDDGEIQALSPGSTTISATCGNATATCNISVIVPVESISLNAQSIKINKGETFQLEATILPENATDKTISWKSSASWNVSVSETGLVNGLYSGEATITATCGNVSASCKVTVVVPAESISMNKSVLDLYIGDTAELSAYITPYDTTDKTIVWSSSNPEVATITEDGVVSALAEGSATITATCSDVSATCDVSVSRFTVAPTISPEPDNYTYKLPDVSIYWGDYDFNIVEPSNKAPTLIYGNIEIDLAEYCSHSVVTSSVTGPWGSWSSTAYVLNISLSKLTLTAPGDYQLTVPEGFVYLIGADIYNDEITQVYRVRSSNDSYFTNSFIVNPAVNSQLTSLDKVTLTYANYPLYENEITPEYLSIYKDNEPMELGENDLAIISNENGSGIVELNFPSLQGVLGKLDIKIAEGAILSKEGKINKTISLSYIVALEDAGVESLLANPDSKISVYSVDGVLIKRDCKAEELKSFAKGIYIIISGKDRYKISL